MKYLLDTDNFTAIVKQNQNVLAKLAPLRVHVYVSDIAIRESIRGAMAAVALAESGKTSLPMALRALTQIVSIAAQFPVLPYDEECDRFFQSWPKRVHRIGPNDCRIAASAIVHEATIVTSNTSDFQMIAASVGDLNFVAWRS